MIVVRFNANLSGDWKSGVFAPLSIMVGTATATGAATIIVHSVRLNLSVFF